MSFAAEMAESKKLNLSNQLTSQIWQYQISLFYLRRRGSTFGKNDVFRFEKCRQLMVQWPYDANFKLHQGSSILVIRTLAFGLEHSRNKLFQDIQCILAEPVPPWPIQKFQPFLSATCWDMYDHFVSIFKPWLTYAKGLYGFITLLFYTEHLCIVWGGPYL